MRWIPIALAALAAAAPASAQRDDDERCTVCEHDPEIMKAAGVVNHGPFIFFKTDSRELQDKLGAWDMVWIETEHFRIGSDLEDWKVPVRDRKAYEAELTELQKTYPKVDPEERSLDRWYRAHLFAARMEAAYAHALGLLGWSDADFQKLPSEEVFLEAKEGDWLEILRQADLEGPARTEGFPNWIGMGRYLGMPMKYEILMLDYEEDMKRVKRDYLGHGDAHPQRWNVSWRVGEAQPVSRCMWFGISAKAEKIRHDQHMHNALLHNAAINMLDGYMLYLVEAPVWLRSAWGHYFTRRNDPEYNFYDLDEGAAEVKRDVDEWKPVVRQLLQKDEAPNFVDLAKIRSYADLGLDEHVVAWSKLVFLMEHDPKAFARWVLLLKSNPDFTNNLGAQREALDQAYGWSFFEAEDAWKAWVLDTYPPK